MKIKDFIAGTLVPRFQYSSFEPNHISIPWKIDNEEISLLLSQADQKLGELNAFGQFIPDINFFIQMHVVKEGTTSSKIEGTQTNIDEAVQKRDFIDPEKRDDWQEVQNYIEAIHTAISDLDTLPLSSRLLKKTHKILLQGVRGAHKMPGEFRTSQNWIGGTSLSDAKYIPPHQDGVLNYMADLENFIHDHSSSLPHLLKIGILHYQFETIHPFLDGNGRIGRLLITLYLVYFGLLTQPTLYISDFLEKHRSLYYDNLTEVRSKNNLEQWLKFFLIGVQKTAENSIETFKQIIALRAQLEGKIISLGKKQLLAKKLLELLYSQPILDISSIAQQLDINFTTANRLVNDFISLEILIEQTGMKRNRQFIFEDYMKLFR